MSHRDDEEILYECECFRVVRFVDDEAGYRGRLVVGKLPVERPIEVRLQIVERFQADRETN